MTVQLKWICETADGCEEAEDPTTATQIGMYAGDPGEYSWVADFNAQSPSVAVHVARLLAASLGEPVEIPDNMLPASGDVHV